MDVLRMCLVLSLCLTLMTHVVFSAPAYGDDVEQSDFQPDFDADLTLIRERRGDDIDDDDVTSDDFLTRFRRQVAQMASGSRSRHSGGRRRGRGRLQARRKYETRRDSRGSRRVHVW